MESFDLEIEHYSFAELCGILNIPDEILNEQSLKKAKQIVLKMHPDKSKLDSQYFLFYSKAYKCIYEIYQYQNKMHNGKDTNAINKNALTETFYEKEKHEVVQKTMKSKNPKQFNDWFNNTFEKYQMNQMDKTDEGYGEWLKSKEDGTTDELNHDTIQTIEQKRQKLQQQQQQQQNQLMVYNEEIQPFCSSTFASSSSGIFGDCNRESTQYYTDLKQAHTETLIPVSQEDYEAKKKYKSVAEYKKTRDTMKLVPMDKANAEKYFENQDLSQDKKAIHMAYKYTQTALKTADKQKSFWGELLLLNNK